MKFKKYLVYILLVMMGSMMISCGGSSDDDGIPSHKKFLKKYESDIMSQDEINKYTEIDDSYLKINDTLESLEFVMEEIKSDEEMFQIPLFIKKNNSLIRISAIKENKYYIEYMKIINETFTVTHDLLIDGTMDIDMNNNKFKLELPKSELKSKTGEESIFVEFKLSEKAISFGSVTVSLLNETEILITGGSLGKKTYFLLKNLLDENPKVKTIVLGQVDGSVDDKINVETGRMIRKRGLNTKVLKNSDIASGGVDLFASGVVRIYSKGAKIGVHSWSGDDTTGDELPKDDKAHYSQLGYFTTMLPQTGYDFYFFTLHAAPFTGIHYMSEDELKKYKLISDNQL